MLPVDSDLANIKPLGWCREGRQWFW